jgi:hypothetical protein
MRRRDLTNDSESIAVIDYMSSGCDNINAHGKRTVLAAFLTVIDCYFSNACAKSAIRSSAFSIPHDSRIMLSGIRHARRRSAGIS